MESIDEIEDFYQREIENLDREFFDNFKKNKNKDLIVKSYRQKLMLLKLNYEKRYKNFLDNQKIQIRKNKEKILSAKNPSKKNPVYEVKKLNFNDIEKKESKNSRKDLFEFRLEMKYRKFYNKIPDFLVVFLIKSKLSIKRFFNSIIKILENIFDYFKEKINGAISAIKDIFAKLYNKTKKSILAIPAALSKIVPKKKDKEKKEDKKDEKKEDKKEENPE